MLERVQIVVEQRASSAWLALLSTPQSPTRKAPSVIRASWLADQINSIYVFYSVTTLSVAYILPWLVSLILLLLFLVNVSILTVVPIWSLWFKKEKPAEALEHTKKTSDSINSTKFNNIWWLFFVLSLFFFKIYFCISRLPLLISK